MAVCGGGVQLEVSPVPPDVHPGLLLQGVHAAEEFAHQPRSGLRRTLLVFLHPLWSHHHCTRDNTGPGNQFTEQYLNNVKLVHFESLHGHEF